ncbi:hypothetical protein [Streptomyces labedae]
MDNTLHAGALRRHLLEMAALGEVLVFAGERTFDQVKRRLCRGDA